MIQSVIAWLWSILFLPILGQWMPLILYVGKLFSKCPFGASLGLTLSASGRFQHHPRWRVRGGEFEVPWPKCRLAEVPQPRCRLVEVPHGRGATWPRCHMAEVLPVRGATWQCRMAEVQASRGATWQGVIRCFDVTGTWLNLSLIDLLWFGGKT